MPNAIQFLSVAQVQQLHMTSLDYHGGIAGLRDARLLDAAVSMARATFGGALLHPTPAAIAAAYLYHIAMAHAFVDGNKRTACFAAMVFLDANGIAHDITPEELELATIEVASGQLSKYALIELFIHWLSRSTRRRPPRLTWQWQGAPD